MKFSFKKKSRWERTIEPIVGKMKGKTLTVNGKELTPETAVKPAARAVGGLLLATVVSAFVSSVRGRDDS